MNDGIERCSLKHYKDNMSMEGMDQTAQLMMQQILVDKEGSDIDRTAMVTLIELITAEARKIIDNLNSKRSFGINVAGGVFSLAAGVHAMPGYNGRKFLSAGRLFGVTDGNQTNPAKLMDISRSSSQAFNSFAKATESVKSISDTRVSAIQTEAKANQDKMETFKNEVMGNKKRKEDDKDRLVSMIDQERGNKGQTIREVTRS